MTKDNLPKGWTWCELETMLDYEQPTPYIVESTDYDDSYETPVLTAGKTFILGKTNETEGIFDQLPVIIFDDFTTATKFVNFKFKVKSSAMKILKPTCSLVNIKFVYYMMQNIHIKSESHKRWWISEYAKAKMPLPPLAEQERIVAKVEEIFSLIDKAIESMSILFDNEKPKALQLKKSILKKAFAGELVPQDPTDQPAIELLKKINGLKEQK